MSLTEESEEQAIDRLLLELGIRLPEIDVGDEETTTPMLISGMDLTPLFEEFNEQLQLPFSA
jgi:hypothetical protein